MSLQPDSLILFQGDSVTDCGRARNAGGDLGRGYAYLVASLAQARRPGDRLRFLNRGISGNRTRDLCKRWDTDCTDLNPTLVSILIGINDVWRRYDSNDPTPLADFEENYRNLLAAIRDRLDARILLMEPFLLPVPEDRKAWREDLDPKLAVVRSLACEFEADLVPLDELFAAAACRAPASYWAPDGVHPSPAGHALIAEAWLQTAGV